MSVINLFKLMILFCVINACANDNSLVKRNEFQFELNGKPSHNCEYQNTLYEYREFDSTWVLRVGAKKEFQLKSKKGDQEKCFQLVVEDVLKTLSREKREIKSIKLYVKYLESVKADVFEAAKNTACNMTNLRKKSKCLRVDVKHKISSSPFFKNLCEILPSYGYKCSKNTVGLNPIPFKPKYLDRKWDNLKKIKGLGINLDNYYFSISVDTYKNEI